MKVGTDIIRISRFENVDEVFINGVYSKKEQGILNEKHNRPQSLAGQFAAKEAFLKATGKGLSLDRLTNIEILRDDEGAPYVLYNDKRYECSISHDGDYAIAVVIISE